jgi:hypothetical protein
MRANIEISTVFRNIVPPANVPILRGDGGVPRGGGGVPGTSGRLPRAAWLFASLSFAAVSLTLGSARAQIEFAETGGTFAPNNLATAAGSTAFASDVLEGFAPHQIPHLNDGIYGNSNSWIGGGAEPPFVGVVLPGALTVASVAFGRDNGGEEQEFTDRNLGTYVLEYTVDAVPDPMAGEWSEIGILNYRATCPPTPWLRHRFNFAPVVATAIRLRVPATGLGAGTAIDELEIYSDAGEILVADPCDLAPPPPPKLALTATGGPVTTPAAPGDVPGADSGNVARGEGAIAFATPPHPAPVHVIAHLNDGNYGNSNSWLGNEPGPSSGDVYGGIYFSNGPMRLREIAFGRDNTGAFGDRTAGVYAVEVTLDEFDPAVDAAVDAANWTLIGVGDVHLTDGSISLRHAYCLGGVDARAVRVLTELGNVIDELELYAEPSAPELLAVEEGGGFAEGNLATAEGAEAFASDVLEGFEPHQIPHINDGIYGNSNSWIGGGALPAFVGVRLAASSTVASVAFGRDNGGEEQFFGDRSLGHYVIQYTDVASPDASTSSCAWTSIGEINLTDSGCPKNPALRHRFDFAPVTATAIRLLVPGSGIAAGTAIDELEIYAVELPDDDVCVLPPELTLVETGGPVSTPALAEEVPNLDSGNIARLDTATPFATPPFPAPVHQIVHLNDGLYGNSNSWLGNEPGPASGTVYAGIWFSGALVMIDGIALGRDNTGGFGDRAVGAYEIQVTLDEIDPSDDASIDAASWTTLGIAAAHLTDGLTALRHVYSFDPVEARAIRLLTVLGNAIDELEVYGEAPPSAPTFLRGDANASGKVDLSDGISVFNFLFLGGTAPVCPDAADANDEGGLTITSGIFILNFLFTGGSAPPSAFPNCDVDPTEDALEACEFPSELCP